MPDMPYTTEYVTSLHGDSMWEAIWSVIRRWDISRNGNNSYASATGDDATRIYDAIKSVTSVRPSTHPVAVAHAAPPPAETPEKGEPVAAWEILGRWVLEQTRSEHLGNDIDGGDVQDKLIELGILVGREVTEPCDPETCQCAEYGLPSMCYRVAPQFLHPAVDAAPERWLSLNPALQGPPVP